MKGYKRILVDNATHTRLKAFSALTDKKMTETLEEISIEKMNIIGVSPIKKTQLKKREYGFKI